MRTGVTARTRVSIAALVFVPVLFHLMIVETSAVHPAFVPRFGVLFKIGLVTTSALMHWVIYSSLLVTFALTLRPGREPLITAIARKMHGAIPDEMVIYTRRVTIAWCCFFAAQLTTSIALFLFAPIVVWSFFVNILDIPLVITMFAVEYVIRLRCLQNPPRHSLAMIVTMVADIRKARAGAARSL